MDAVPGAGLGLGPAGAAGRGRGIPAGPFSAAIGWSIAARPTDAAAATRRILVEYSLLVTRTPARVLRLRRAFTKSIPRADLQNNIHTTPRTKHCAGGRRRSRPRFHAIALLGGRRHFCPGETTALVGLRGRLCRAVPGFEEGGCAAKSILKVPPPLLLLVYTSGPGALWCALWPEAESLSLISTHQKPPCPLTAARGKRQARRQATAPASRPVRFPLYDFIKG